MKIRITKYTCVIHDGWLYIRERQPTPHSMNFNIPMGMIIIVGQPFGDNNYSESDLWHDYHVAIISGRICKIRTYALTLLTNDPYTHE